MLVNRIYAHACHVQCTHTRTLESHAALTIMACVGKERRVYIPWFAAIMHARHVRMRREQAFV